MTASRTAARGAAVSALALCMPLAQAHSGHGHGDYGTLDGVLHALTEPDHLAMLGAGLVLTAWLAPRVLRGLQRARAALRARIGQAIAARDRAPR